MSEYIEIETELSDDGNTMHFYTNLPLADDGPEYYETVAAMEEGSPVVQMLALITGIATLSINESEMTIRRESDSDWHIIVADVSAALKDFFL